MYTLINKSHAHLHFVQTTATGPEPNVEKVYTLLLAQLDWNRLEVYN